MKKITFLLAFFLMLSINLATHAQTTLNAGDIVITGYNLDGGDQFSFLLLVDIDANTEIKFTDRGWAAAGAFYSGSTTEGTAVWATGVALTCGTEVVISATSATSSSSDIGSITSGGFDFASSGDQIIAYQGIDSSPTFITIFHNESGVFDVDAANVNDSTLPSGLVEGISAFSVNAEIDNLVYSGVTTSGTAEAIRTAIYSNSSNTAQTTNWTRDNSISQTLSAISWSFSSCIVTLSVDQLNLENISLYQSDRNTLRIVGIQEGDVTVRIYDIQGKQVLNDSFQGAGVNDIALSRIRTGLYIVQLETQAGALNKKIIID